MSLLNPKRSLRTFKGCDESKAFVASVSLRCAADQLEICSLTYVQTGLGQFYVGTACA